MSAQERENSRKTVQSLRFQRRMNGASSQGKRTGQILPGTQFSAADTFIALEPKLDRQELKPASFPHIKALRRSPLRLPKIQLAPARLLSRQSLAVAVAASGVSPILAFVEPEVPSLDAVTKTTSEPLWHSLLSPSSGGRSRILAPEAPAPISTLAANKSLESSADWGLAGDIDLGLSDSRTGLPPILDEPPRKVWFWQAIEGLFLSKQFSRAVAVAMILLLASTINVPWNSWTRNSLDKATEPIAGMMRQLSTPMKDRAAFFIVDDFSNGLDKWKGSNSLRVDPAGWATVTRGLSVLSSTTDLQDYRLDFETRVQSGAMGWTVRTANESNYYRFKLNMEGSAESPRFTLVRQAVVDGVREAFSQPIEVPAHLAKADDFNGVSVRLVGDQITTLVNGFGIDYWKDERLARGGIGLMADAGESALVRRITVSGNDDAWGLLLYGAVESIRSVEEMLGMGDGAPVAMITFYRPGQGLAQLQQPLLLQGPLRSH
jgi:hypothetical protein